MICWHIRQCVIMVERGWGPQFGRVINGLSANISHPVVLYYDNYVL